MDNYYFFFFEEEMAVLDMGPGLFLRGCFRFGRGLGDGLYESVDEELDAVSPSSEDSSEEV